MNDNYTPYSVVAAQGAHIRIMTCKRCGAAVLLEDNAPSLHDDWHTKNDPAEVPSGALPRCPKCKKNSLDFLTSRNLYLCRYIIKCGYASHDRPEETDAPATN